MFYVQWRIYPSRILEAKIQRQEAKGMKKRVTKETLEDIVDELSEIVGRYNKARFDPHTIQVGDYMHGVLPILRDLQALLRRQGETWDFLPDREEEEYA